MMPALATNSQPKSLSKILAPVKLSAQAVNGLTDVVLIAQKLGAQVTLLNVVNLNIAREETGIPRERLLRELCQSAEQELAKLVQYLWRHGIKASTSVRTGDPSEAILHEAQGGKADLIIMAEEKRAWYRRLLRRNIPRQVAERSPCPVMLIMEDSSTA